MQTPPDPARRDSYGFRPCLNAICSRISPGPGPPTSPAGAGGSRRMSMSITAATHSERWSRSTWPGWSYPRSGSRSADGSLRSSASGRCRRQRAVSTSRLRFRPGRLGASSSFRSMAALSGPSPPMTMVCCGPTCRYETPPTPPGECRSGGTSAHLREAALMEGSPALEGVEAPVDPEDALRASQPLPHAFPVLPLRETVTFPETLTPLAVGQERSIKLVNDVLGANRMLVMAAARDPGNGEPGPDDLSDVGVAGVVARMLKVPDGTIRILVQGTQRVRLGPYVAEQPQLVARLTARPHEVEENAELEALTRNVQRTFSEIIEQIPYLPEELQMAVANIDAPAALAHLIAGALRISTEEKQELLEEVEVAARLRRLSQILARELEVVQLGTQIQSQVQSEIDKGQREFFLRQQLKAIQDELGEGDEQQAEVNELRQRIEEAELPEHAQKAAERELSRLEKLPPAAAEHGVIRTYLEWLVELPWAAETEDNLDIAHAREVLDADHYDLEKGKDSILEYLAVRKLKPASPGPS